MLKDEFIELGGKDEDYEEANRIYMELDLWLDRHEFMAWWPAFGGDTSHYIELLNAVKVARRVSIESTGLYEQRETMLRYVMSEEQKLIEEIKRLEQSAKRLATIRKKLILNKELYNR